MSVEQQSPRTFPTSRIHISPTTTPPQEHVLIKFPRWILPSAKSVLTLILWSLGEMMPLDPMQAAVARHVELQRATMLQIVSPLMARLAGILHLFATLTLDITVINISKA